MTMTWLAQGMGDVTIVSTGGRGFWNATHSAYGHPPTQAVTEREAHRFQQHI